jgi:hypothetical protein
MDIDRLVPLVTRPLLRTSALSSWNFQDE